MTEHVAHDPHAGHGEAVGHDHGDHGGGHGHDDSPEAVAKEIRRYLIVFGALAILTLITVGISYLDLPRWQAIVLALVVAAVKGSLVAAFFMHLLSERKLIYAVLVLTVFFFAVLMWGPWHHRYNAESVWPGYDVNASKPATTETSSTVHPSH